jgi:UDP-N-acetylglucosamine 2-epimerase (non-hydrolysing)
LNLTPHAYFLVTMHRAENVDDPVRLRGLLTGLTQIGETYRQPVIVSLHPRTADKLKRFDIAIQSSYVQLLTPFGFFDFVKLEQHARCIISDSGTVQEEATIFNIPSVTIRDVTERAETIEVGGNMLSGGDADDLRRAVDVVLRTPTDWTPPIEYTAQHVSRVVAKVVLGYHHRQR